MKERIERGEKVDEHTLSRVAKAFRLLENALVGPRYVPNDEEIIAQVEKTMNEVTTIEAYGLSTETDCEAILACDCFFFDDHQMTEDMAEDIAAFKDMLRDWVDIYSDLSATEWLDARRSVLAEIVGIEAKGCQVRYSVYESEDQFTVAVLVLVAKGDRAWRDIKQLVVPRQVTSLVRANL